MLSEVCVSVLNFPCSCAGEAAQAPCHGSWRYLVEIKSVFARSRSSVQFSILRTTTSQIVKRFRQGLVLKVDRLLYHSTLGSRVIKKKRKVEVGRAQVPGTSAGTLHPPLVLRYPRNPNLT